MLHDGESCAAYDWLKVLTEGHQPMLLLCQQSIRLISRASGPKRSVNISHACIDHLQAFPCISLSERNPSRAFVVSIRCLYEDINRCVMYRIRPTRTSRGHGACNFTLRLLTWDAEDAPMSFTHPMRDRPLLRRYLR